MTASMGRSKVAWLACKYWEMVARAVWVGMFPYMLTASEVPSLILLLAGSSRARSCCLRE